MMKKLYTSCFDNAKKLIESKEVEPSRFVCVAGYAPKWFLDTEGVTLYPDLAPRKTWLKELHDRGLGEDFYEKKYRETVLDRLDVKQVLNELGDGVIVT